MQTRIKREKYTFSVLKSFAYVCFFFLFIDSPCLVYYSLKNVTLMAAFPGLAAEHVQDRPQHRPACPAAVPANTARRAPILRATPAADPPLPSTRHCRPDAECSRPFSTFPPRTAAQRRGRWPAIGPPCRPTDPPCRLLPSTRPARRSLFGPPCRAARRSAKPRQCLDRKKSRRSASG